MVTLWSFIDYERSRDCRGFYCSTVSRGQFVPTMLKVCSTKLREEAGAPIS
jgi:hypothetical protein